MAKGLFIGNSHANGGIPSEIAETGTKIEIEGNEYYICNEAYNSTNHFDFKKKTNKEILDFIYTEFACKLNQDIMHSGDFIVCKVVVADNRKKDRKGTIKQILNEMQGEKNCKVESSSNYLKQGGLIAPNGKKSNLTPEQYKLVRTPAFKKWFGDWENDAANSSKVVDENGEPMVVYHGTKSWDIYEFDSSKSKRISSGLKEFGTYFTDNKKLAESYRDWSDLKKEEITDIDKEIYKWDEFRYQTRNNRDYDYAEQQIKALKEFKKGKIYSVFLNLKKMYSFDAKKEINIEAWNNLEVKASYKLARNRDAMEFLKEGKFGVEKVDGIQAKNIVDAFVQTEELKKELLSNVYLVFDSKNIKLADGTNTTFDSNNPDIRYKKGGELIKRADGSYSKRGLWDNIRANIGSGRKPTKEMLKQEAIIREKYHLGGDMSKHLAPNGKPSNLTHEQWHLVRTDAFKQWFGDWEKLAYAKFKDSGMDEITLANLSKDVSKVVDENGEPLVVFHGTNKEFNVFSEKGKGNRVLGYFFTANKDFSENYGETKLYFLNIKKIKNYVAEKFDYLNTRQNAENGYWDIEKEKLLKELYNGILIDRNDFFAGINIKRKDFIAFNPNQIKLADGSNTTFDSNNPDIRYDLGGKIKVNQSEDRGDLSYFIDGKKVAYANYQFDLESSLSENLSKYKSELYLEMVEVDENFRNRGIAKELLKKVISIAENLNVEVISLRRESGLGCDYGSDYDNYLKTIYESLGFVEFNVEDCAMKLVLKNRNDLGGNIKTQNNDMETEIKEYRYNLTARPFSIGTYPSESKFGFLRFEENDRFGTVIYSKKLPLEKVKNYELSPITDIFIYDGKKMLFHNKFPAKIEVKVNERNRSYVSIIPEKEGVKNIQMGSIDFLEELENGKHTIIDDSESKEIEKGVENNNKKKINLKEFNKNIFLTRKVNTKKYRLLEGLYENQNEKFKNSEFYFLLGKDSKIVDALNEKGFFIDNLENLGLVLIVDVDRKIAEDLVNLKYNNIGLTDLGIESFKEGGYDFINNESKELEKGIAVEQEHLKTFEKVAAGDITPEQAIVETAQEHIAENPNYYDELEKIEKKSDNKEMIIEQTEEIKTDIESYKNPYEVNKAIERLLDQKGDSDNYSSKELEFISYYSGYGGLEKFGKVGNERLKTLIYEFYTPDAVVKKMWALAYKYGYGTIADNSVFEPSVGIGAFLKYAPKDVKLVANEINEYSAKICEILYPNAKVELKYFEQNFLKSNLSIKSRTENLEKYSLVIGNPPYGRLDSKYTAMGEDSFTKAGNFTEYFITRGLDLLVQGGLLIYIVGAEQYNGGSLFLDSGLSKVKEIIFDKADLLDAYRLPINIFERTGVSSEIVVFKKR